MSAPAIADPNEGHDPRLGQTLNERYRITRKIGEGGMGLVYEGEHLIIRRRVAIKMLHAHMSQNPEVVARFRREAIAATSIRHPHIIEVLDMGTAPDGASYMVLEFLEGQDWSKEIEKTGPQPLGHVVKVLREVCEGLQAAHDAGIVHRDLKPENVFLTKHGRRTDFVKIVDFGISKIMNEADPATGEKKGHSLTKTGAAMGTPYSMAPEQLKGARDVDHRADLWALGVMLFHGLTGGYPFDGETFPMLAVNVLTGDAPPLSRYRADLPPQIQAILEGLLQKEKERRFPSARDVRNALEPFELETGSPMVVGQPGADGGSSHAASGIQPTALGNAAMPTGSVPTPALPVPGGPAAAVPPPVGAATGPLAAARTPASVPVTAITPAAFAATATPATLPAISQGTLSGTVPGLPGAAPNRAPLVLGSLAIVAVAAIGITWAVTSGAGSAPTPPPVAEAPATPPAPTPSPVVADPTPTPTPPPAPTPTAATATVRVQITTDPEGAELFLDGSPIGNPFDADLPSNTDVHHLEARMEGRVTATRDISLAFPQRIVLELAREGRGGRGSSSGTSTGSSGGSASTGSSGGAATTGSSGGTTVAAPPDPPPHVDPPPPDTHADDPPASGSSGGTSSGGRPLRDPFAGRH